AVEDVGRVQLQQPAVQLRGTRIIQIRRQVENLEPEQHYRRRVVDDDGRSLLRRLQQPHALVNFLVVDLHPDDEAFNVFACRHVSLRAHCDGRWWPAVLWLFRTRLPYVAPSCRFPRRVSPPARGPGFRRESGPCATRGWRPPPRAFLPPRSARL